ncbi:hypothetical protein Tco_0064325 [Tanacetum coccineum]
MFIKSRIYLDDEYVDMTCNKFLQYTRLEIPNSRDTLIQHMESVKKSIDERAKHKEEYDSWKALGTNPKTGYKQQIKNDAYPMMQISQTHDDEEPMVENVEQCHDTCPLPAKLTDNQNTEHLTSNP